MAESVTGRRHNGVVNELDQIDLRDDGETTAGGGVETVDGLVARTSGPDVDPTEGVVDDGATEPAADGVRDDEIIDAGGSSDADSMPGRPHLNPAQRQVLDELGTTDRPIFRSELRAELVQYLEESLGSVLTDLPEPIFLSKHHLGLLHGCQARYVAEQNRPFAWSVASARGAVAHKAIELMVTYRQQPTPLDLVERALDRIEDSEQSLGDFLRQLDEGERAELAGRANDFVTTFMETFPPLERQWKPVTEYSIRALLCDDQLTLRGKADLSLGYIRQGREAGKVLIDLKTGQPFHAHLEDLRFYALLETLKMGVPPRLLVNYYLDAGSPRSELVTEDLLWSAARRLVDGISIVAELAPPNGREPTRTVGANCRWCPINDECEEGSRHLARSEEDDWRPS